MTNWVYGGFRIKGIEKCNYLGMCDYSGCDYLEALQYFESLTEDTCWLNPKTLLCSLAQKRTFESFERKILFGSDLRSPFGRLFVEHHYFQTCTYFLDNNLENFNEH